MTQEQKDLLFNNLCARLPYGVKALFFDVDKNYTSIIEGIDIYKFIKDDSGMESEISDVKPYLFPLSSMTEEQEEEYNTMYEENRYSWRENIIDWFHKNHLDYRGLIPKSLAIDATGLNIY